MTPDKKVNLNDLPQSGRDQDTKQPEEFIQKKPNFEEDDDDERAGAPPGENDQAPAGDSEPTRR